MHKSVMEELKRIIDDSEITKEDDALWPPPDRVGRQVGEQGLFSLLLEFFCISLLEASVNFFFMSLLFLAKRETNAVVKPVQCLKTI